MDAIKPKIAAELASDVYLVQHERTVKAFLARPEFSSESKQKSHLKAEVGSRLINTRDGFGVCARGGVDYENDLFLVFRGTTRANKDADWISNARIGVQFSRNGLPVHVGFNHIFTSMLPAIKDFLSTQKNLSGTIHCVGHSLGGAIATLAADWISSHKNNCVKLYTFGAPRPGLILFSNNLTRKLGSKNIYRTYHATDPVPMIPLFPFVHPPLPGYGHYISTQENILSAQAHDIGYYLQSVEHRQWTDLQRRGPPYHAEHAIEEFLKSKMPVNATSPKIWHWLNAALIFVLKKVLGNIAVALQTAFMGAFTLADSIAWMLRQGIDLGKQVSEWVQRLMRKIMQVLGMKVASTSEELTRELMRRVLASLMERANNEARKAIQRSNMN